MRDEDSRATSRALMPLVAVIAAILVTAAMRTASTVFLPLVFALFLVAVFWPLQHQLQRKIPHGLAAFVTLLAFFGVVWAFGKGLNECGEMIAEAWPKYEEQLGRMVQQGSDFLESAGLPAISIDKLQEAGSESGGKLLHYGQRLLGALGSFLLMVGFFVLGLLEVRAFRRKFKLGLEDRAERNWPDLFNEGARDFQKYIVVRTGLGLVSGILAWILSEIIGLDLAFVWGFQTFLLNYIPTIGSVVATVLPVIFALVQYESWAWAGGVLAGFGFIQVAMGVWIGPLVQGRYLSLSPLVVLLSVTFWGWVWGIVGAFISVPLTIGIVVACRQSPRTRWIATMLADVDDLEEDEPDSGGQD